MSRRLLAYGEQKVTMTGPTGLRAKSARTRVNPTEHAGTDEKNPTSELVGFSIWWSWGDLNPRPQAIFEQIYMFSGLI